MDARLESFVKMADFVGREKEDARIEFEHSKEDRDHAVATHVLAITSLKKDVGFIELEKYRISTYRGVSTNVKVIIIVLIRPED